MKNMWFNLKASLKQYSKTPYNIFLVVFLSVCAYFFYGQATKSHYSDLKEHIKFTLPNNHDNAYSFFHRIVILFNDFSHLSCLSNYQFNTIIAIIILIVSLFFTFKLTNDYLKENYKNHNFYFIDSATIALMIVGMIYVYNPLTNGLIIGNTGNPWYSPTYTLCKPFSLLVFILVIKVYKKNIGNEKYIESLIGLSFFSLLSMGSKPSFLMSFLPAIFIFFIYKFFKKEINFVFLFHIGLAIIPSIISFLLINNSVYHNPKSVNVIEFSWGAGWYNLTNSIWLSIFVSAAFPLYVFIIYFKKLNFSFLLAFINFVFAILIYFFLIEKGTNFTAGNFRWGFMYGLFFMFLFSFETFFLIKTHPKKYNLPGYLLFNLHFASGCAYFFKAFFKII